MNKGKLLPLNGITTSWEKFLDALGLAASTLRDGAQAFYHLHYNGASSGVPHGHLGAPVDLNGWEVTDPEVVEPMRECRELYNWFLEASRDLADGRYKTAKENFNTLLLAISKASERFKEDRAERERLMADRLERLANLS